MDLRPYDAIDACGYPGLKSIDLASLGVATSPEAAGEHFARRFIERLDEA
jgi:lipoyl(octanoyl) transferase